MASFPLIFQSVSIFHSVWRNRFPIAPEPNSLHRFQFGKRLG
jgi:hypothetical protein